MANEREEAIRERAHAIWRQEGCPDGKSLAHWLQAEAEIGAEQILGVTDNGKIIKRSRRGVVVTETIGAHRRSQPSYIDAT